MLLMTVIVLAGLPAMLTAVTTLQPISEGVVMEMISVAMMALEMVMAMLISMLLPMRVADGYAIGLVTREGVMPEMRLLVEISMESPLVDELKVAKVKLP